MPCLPVPLFPAWLFILRAVLSRNYRYSTARSHFSQLILLWHLCRDKIFRFQLNKKPLAYFCPCSVFKSDSQPRHRSASPCQNYLIHLRLWRVYGTIQYGKNHLDPAIRKCMESLKALLVDELTGTSYAPNKDQKGFFFLPRKRTNFIIPVESKRSCSEFYPAIPVLRPLL